jgi:hypothetical protein
MSNEKGDVSFLGTGQLLGRVGECFGRETFEFDMIYFEIKVNSKTVNKNSRQSSARGQKAVGSRQKKRPEARCQ